MELFCDMRDFVLFVTACVYLLTLLRLIQYMSYFFFSYRPTSVEVDHCLVDLDHPKRLWP